MKNSRHLESLIIRMIEILEQASEEHWTQYFQNALQLLKKGKVVRCKKWILGAYGGMCSFNDISLNFIDEKTYNEALMLRKKLYSESNNLTFWERIFG
jgi:hypothetical protein